MAKSEYQEIIAEYKEQVRILKEQVNELTDACKAKDSALKRALQKLEYTTDDLDKMQSDTSPFHLPQVFSYILHQLLMKFYHFCKK